MISNLGSLIKYTNDSLSNSKFFMGLLMLLMNIASRYVTIKLSKNQEDLIKNTIGRQFLIFGMSWMATKDVILSLGLTAVFVVLAQFLLNEESKFYILTKDFKASIDTNNDGTISDEEIQNAIKVLEKAKNSYKEQEKLKQVNRFYK
jgi:hypothetical protein